ncbi:VOC family protein [Herbiconiux sp.]|jgi:PhnB protein|uniref:VOC family protein n=1 Tax=Herbiconiux sp. TaxID=1871186 RepID=UPI0025C301E7|nr:VOC family protein [Herbiconiux sp.]
MTTNLNPYINFRGQAAEAGDFYRSVLGGTITRSTFADFGMPVEPGEEGLVMHSQLVTDGGLVLMISDVPAKMDLTPGNNITVSLSGDDVDELRGYFDRLSEGATIFVPMEKAPWGDYFGQLTDKFGINWMVNGGGTPDSPTE